MTYMWPAKDVKAWIVAKPAVKVASTSSTIA
jgi:hypothetical protein